jgi:hypothetical protein
VPFTILYDNRIFFQILVGNNTRPQHLFASSQANAQVRHFTKKKKKDLPHPFSV